MQLSHVELRNVVDPETGQTLVINIAGDVLLTLRYGPKKPLLTNRQFAAGMVLRRLWERAYTKLGHRTHSHLAKPVRSPPNRHGRSRIPGIPSRDSADASAKRMWRARQLTLYLTPYHRTLLWRILMDNRPPRNSDELRSIKISLNRVATAAEALDRLQEETLSGARTIWPD